MIELSIEEVSSGKWRVLVTPEMGVTGFTSEDAAARWLAEYLAALTSRAGDRQADLMRAALIASDPRGRTS